MKAVAPPHPAIMLNEAVDVQGYKMMSNNTAQQFYEFPLTVTFGPYGRQLHNEFWCPLIS